MPKLWLLPAMLAVVAGIGTSVFVYRYQAGYSVQLVTFQLLMIGAALLVTAKQSWLQLVSPLLLVGGAFVTGMSVGMFYVPSAVAAAIVAARRSKQHRATPDSQDNEPQKGVIYTESELEAIRSRQRL